MDSSLKVSISVTYNVKLAKSCQLSRLQVIVGYDYSFEIIIIMMGFTSIMLRRDLFIIIIIKKGFLELKIFFLSLRGHPQYKN